MKMLLTLRKKLVSTIIRSALNQNIRCLEDSMANPNRPCDTLASQRPFFKVSLSYSCCTRTLTCSLKLSISNRSGKGGIAEGRQNKQSRREFHNRLIGSMVLREIEGLLWDGVEEEDFRFCGRQFILNRLKNVFYAEQKVQSQMGLRCGASWMWTCWFRTLRLDSCLHCRGMGDRWLDYYPREGSRWKH